MFKRNPLTGPAMLIGTNFAVIMVLGVVMSFLGLDQGSYIGILIFSFLFGMGGAFVSLLMSKKMALRSVGGQIIETPRNETEQWLLETVRMHADRAGIDMPDVAYYQADHLNAFATGAKRNDALVAVSTGLINGMSRDEASAVLGHEVAHVANGDMVTMTLIQGVLNTFVFFLARMVARVISGGERGGMSSFMVIMVLQVVFGFLASIIAGWFSRRREFRADIGGAQLTSPAAMASALQRLKAPSSVVLPENMTAMGISANKLSGLKSLISTHPDIDDRIARLRNVS